MREYLNIGATPSDESCAQVGSHNYAERLVPSQTALACESKASLMTLAATSEVICYYDDSDAAIAYAFRCESDGPTRWDEDALTILHLHGYAFPDPDGAA